MQMSFEGPPKYVRMPRRDEVGTVIQVGKNMGGSINVYAYVGSIEATGEVCFYGSSRVTRCDEDGN
ncbi:hypothetical protein [Microlunatus antarcticus]|uniref:Uncharacterized protein n=1 Tax=Microlunatus antarcticus TaxID=53388 RepID=A0A7W5P6K3_9ACTN|nr:hypothetical protein [Microlunatus antarcticus]MBB3326528.1 hypothetical protein [Microlunatus antarcticus]